MLRTYLPWLGLSAVVATAGLGLQERGRAAALFDSRPLDGSRFAVLARAVGRNDWNLLVLEQIAASPRCWETRADGLIDPALNRFDFSGICSRYLDSNGYSVRVDQQDLASSYRLRLSQQGSSLLLLAMTPENPAELVVGRGSVNQRDRDAFVAINLEPGWELQRRFYGRQSLNHVYFANATPLAQLIAASGRGADQGSGGAQGADGGLSATALASGGPIPLQVIPFRD